MNAPGQGARLAGKVALITGAASGIGLATARRFAEEGARVIFSDRDAILGEAAAAKAQAARFLALDVTQEQQWSAVIGDIAAHEKRLDILVNNAGVGLFSELPETTLEQWRLVQAVNVEGVFLGCKHAVPLMRQTATPEKAAAIINLSSVAGKVGAPLMTAYCASKGAVTMLTKSLAMESARLGWNIRVNSVHPGYVETTMVGSHIERTEHPERTRQFLEKLHPMGRMGNADEIAAGLLFLASDEASFATGAELVLDGGLTAQ